MWIISNINFPRTFKHRAQQKKRTLRSTFKCSFLTLGTVGLQIISPCFADNTHFFRLRLLLNRSSRRSESTMRFYWLHQFPQIPVTKKPQGARMGKGKGPRCGWRAYLNPGRIFVETKGLRCGRACFFFSQLSKRLAFSYKPIFSHSKRTPIPNSKDAFMQTRL